MGSTLLNMLLFKLNWHEGRDVKQGEQCLQNVYTICQWRALAHVCLLLPCWLGFSAGLRKNYQTDFHETWTEDLPQPKNRPHRLLVQIWIRFRHCKIIILYINDPACLGGWYLFLSMMWCRSRYKYRSSGFKCVLFDIVLDFIQSNWTARSWWTCALYWVLFNFGWVTSKLSPRISS